MEYGQPVSNPPLGPDRTCETGLSECGPEAPGDPSIAFQKPYPEFWNGVQARDAVWQTQSLGACRCTNTGASRFLYFLLSPYPFKNQMFCELLYGSPNRLQLQHDSGAIRLGFCEQGWPIPLALVRSRVGKLPRPACA
jgi:hypothetical protein